MVLHPRLVVTTHITRVEVKGRNEVVPMPRGVARTCAKSKRSPQTRIVVALLTTVDTKNDVWSNTIWRRGWR